MKLNTKLDELATKAAQALKQGALFDAERLTEKAFQWPVRNRITWRWRILCRC